MWDKPAHWDDKLHGEWMIGECEGSSSRQSMCARDAPARLIGKQMPAREPVQGSSPQMLHGLQLGKAGAPFRFLHPRREVRHTNHIADIKGAAADSCRQGLFTGRRVDPLQPNYHWPSIQGKDISSQTYCPTPDLTPVHTDQPA